MLSGQDTKADRKELMTKTEQYENLRVRAFRAIERRDETALKVQVSILWGFAAGTFPEDGRLAEELVAFSGKAPTFTFHMLIRELGRIDTVYRANQLRETAPSTLPALNQKSSLFDLT